MATPHLKGKVSLDDSGALAALRRVEKAGTQTAGKLKGIGGSALSGLVSGGIAGIATALTAGSFTQGISNTIKLGGSLYNLSKSSGVAVGQLYQLVGVFSESEMGAEDVAKSMARMNKAISEARSGSGTAAQTFASLHLDLQKLSRFAPAQQFQFIARAINAIKDPADKARLAMDIFGKSGASLIPVFEDVAKINLQNLSGAAETLQRNAALFDDVGDKMEQMKRNAQGLFIGITSELLSAISGVQDAATKLDFVPIGKSIGFQIAQGFAATFNLGKLISQSREEGAEGDAARKTLGGAKDKSLSALMHVLSGATYGVAADVTGLLGSVATTPVGDAAPALGRATEWLRRMGREQFQYADAIRDGAIAGVTKAASVDRPVSPFHTGALQSPFSSIGALTGIGQEQNRRSQGFYGFQDASGATGDAVPDLKASVDKLSAKMDQYWGR